MNVKELGGLAVIPAQLELTSAIAFEFFRVWKYN